LIKGVNQEINILIQQPLPKQLAPENPLIIPWRAGLFCSSFRQCR
jgi:hypothetical protein